jgi:hypothetical protein
MLATQMPTDDKENVEVVASHSEETAVLTKRINELIAENDVLTKQLDEANKL